MRKEQFRMSETSVWPWALKRLQLFVIPRDGCIEDVSRSERDEKVNQRRREGRARARPRVHHFGTADLRNPALTHSLSASVRQWATTIEHYQVHKRKREGGGCQQPPMEEIHDENASNAAATRKLQLDSSFEQVMLKGVKHRQ